MNNLNLSYPQKIDEALPANLECGLPKPPSDWPVRYVSGIPEIPSTCARRCMSVEETPKIQLVDCREESEWNAGHLQDAKWIPLSNMNPHLQNLRKDAPILVYCHSGQRSLQATAFFQEQGFLAYSIQGGILELQEQ